MPLYATVLTGGANNFQTTSEHLNALAKDVLSGQGVIGSVANTAGVAPTTGGFSLNASGTPDTNVQVGTGVAYVTATPSSQAAQLIRVEQKVAGSVAIASNTSGSTKFDWIYISINAANAAAPNVAGDNVATLVTSRSTSALTDNGTPPTYGLLLGVVTVANSFTTITNSVIADRRTQTAANSASAAGWTPMAQAWSFASNNGNKEYTISATGDFTGTYSPGMRVRIPRTTTAPTQSMSFTAASSQYATKATPTGLSFTSAFTTEAWVYLNSYTGSIGTIIRRASSGNGWGFRVNGNGLVSQFYQTSSNVTEFTSYQSIPLKRWVHIAAVTTSVAGKAGQIYINGVAVPTQAPAFASTTLTQAGNLFVGSNEVTGEYFDGYISEVRVWSAAQSQANILAYMNASLTGSETNLVALFQGNGNFNDKTSNANNLTATNGAISTQASNPMNSIEYAIITRVAFSAGTTTLTLFTGLDSNIPNQTISAPAFSTERVPYGFPAERTRWVVDSIYRAPSTGITPGGFQNVGSVQITIPSGSWSLSYLMDYTVTYATAAGRDNTFGLSTVNGTPNLDMSLYGSYNYYDNSATIVAHHMRYETPSLTFTAPTVVYAMVATSANATNIVLNQAMAPFIRVQCPYV